PVVMAGSSPARARIPYYCCCLHSQTAIRIFTLIRFAITCAIVLSTLIQHESNQAKLDESKRSASLLEKYDWSDKVESKLNQFLYREKARRQLEDAQVFDLYTFFMDIIFLFCHIFVTSLLWAGAVSNKKSCLPIYAILEGLLLIVSSLHFLSYLVRSGTIKDADTDIAFVCLIVFFLFYCFFFAPRLIGMYYVYLNDNNVRRRNELIGRRIDVEKAIAK
ncbi:hypothetical protein PENTCL1PPCAC_6028, partial [Pristionchus entomophagus]